MLLYSIIYIQLILKEKIINKLPIDSNENNSSNMKKCCIQKTYQIVRKIRQIKENFYVLAANQQEEIKSSNIDCLQEPDSKKYENSQAEKPSNDNLFIFQVETNLLNSNDQLNKEKIEDENKISNFFKNYI
jgi:hypothetical protein